MKGQLLSFCRGESQQVVAGHVSNIFKVKQITGHYQLLITCQ
jgi:hypothetical protein